MLLLPASSSTSSRPNAIGHAAAIVLWADFTVLDPDTLDPKPAS